MPLVQRLLGAALALLFLVAVLVFASIALGVLLAAGLVVWAWLWWHSRSLPRRHTIGGSSGTSRIPSAFTTGAASASSIIRP